MPGHVYAVAGGKGGVGKTTTVVNLGVVLRRADHTVALVDADLGMANLGTMVGVDGEATIHDVLAGETSVEEALVEEAPGFAVLTGSAELTDYPAADPQSLRAVLEPLVEAYDFVLVDTGAGMSHEDVLPLGLADRVLLVTTPDPTAIGDTRKTAELARLAEGTIGGLVVTMADESTDATYVARQVGVGLLGVIPYDASVRQSTASATPLEAAAPESPAAAAYRELAEVLVDASMGGIDQAAGADGAAEPAPTGQGAGPAATADVEAEPANEEEPPGEPGEEAPPAGQPEPTEPAAVEANEPADSGPADDDAVADTAEPVDGTPAAGGAGAAEAVEEAATPADDPADGEEPDEGADAAEVGSGDDEGAPAEVDAEEPTDDDTPEADEVKEDDEDDLDDYLAEFEDVEPERSGGFFARLRRLFR